MTWYSEREVKEFFIEKVWLHDYFLTQVGLSTDDWEVEGDIYTGDDPGTFYTLRVKAKTP